MSGIQLQRTFSSFETHFRVAEAQFYRLSRKKYKKIYRVDTITNSMLVKNFEERKQNGVRVEIDVPQLGLPQPRVGVFIAKAIYHLEILRYCDNYKLSWYFNDISRCMIKANFDTSSLWKNHLICPKYALGSPLWKMLVSIAQWFKGGVWKGMLDANSVLTFNFVTF